MVYVRGSAEDFDTWDELGATGWAMPTCCPISSGRRILEEGRQAGVARTAAACPARAGQNPLVRAFVEAGREAGFETTEDYNGEKQEGFGLWSRPSMRASAGLQPPPI